MSENPFGPPDRLLMLALVSKFRERDKVFRAHADQLEKEAHNPNTSDSWISVRIASLEWLLRLDDEQLRLYWNLSRVGTGTQS